MEGNAEHPRLDALNALLVSAQQLAQALESEPTIRPSARGTCISRITSKTPAWSSTTECATAS